MSKTAWILVIVAALLILVIVGASVIAPYAWGQGYGPGWGMMGPWMMGGGFGFPMVGGIMMLLFWGLIIGGAVWLVQLLTRSARTAGPGALPSEAPLDILKRRYAKGEITKEQFEEMKHDLGQ